MHNKPKFVLVVANIFIALAISFPVQIMLVYKHGPLDIIPIFTKLTPLNYILMGLFCFTAYLTYTMNKLIFILLPFLNFFVFMNNFIVAEYGQDFTHAQTIVASTAFLMLTLSFYQKDIYNVYNDMKFRWWLTSPRFKKQIPIRVTVDGETYFSKTFDISKTGMFIETDDLYRIFKIENGKEITVRIMKERPIDLVAKVVRKSIAKGHYPAGIGIHFDYIERAGIRNYKDHILNEAA